MAKLGRQSSATVRSTGVCSEQYSILACCRCTYVVFTKVSTNLRMPAQPWRWSTAVRGAKSAKTASPALDTGGWTLSAAGLAVCRMLTRSGRLIDSSSFESQSR